MAVALAYYWVLHGETAYFFSHFLKPSFAAGFSMIAFNTVSLIIYLPLLVLYIAGYVTMPQQRRLNNYQNRLAQLFFVTSLLLLSIPLLARVDLNSAVLLYLPALSFITTHLFYLVRRPLTDFIISILFIVSILFMSYQAEFMLTRWPERVNRRATVNPELAKIISGKRIWVLGEHKELYTYGSLGTTFFDWPMSKPYLENLNYYDNLVFINGSIDHFKPEIIIDYEFLWRPIVDHIPSLEEQYEPVRPFVWQRKPE
jgi:hypothetical protein